MFKIKEVIIDAERDSQIEFLDKHRLDYEYDITYAILVYEDKKIIATASLANNVMKCFLIAKEYSGQNITGLMFNHLVSVLNERGIYHYFVYTTPENEKVFTSLNMKKIAKTMNTVLLEGGDNIEDVLLWLKNEYNVSNNKKACVIINANPMTLGHYHLIETAAKKHSEVLVFVVSEDMSSFPFKDRFEIIKEATKAFINVTVLPTLSYLVSRITFPKYFLKEDQLIKEEQTLIDVLVYKEYYTRIFNIHTRYLGEEPYSFNTDKYNKVLKDHLGNHIKIIRRKEVDEQIVSASLVRKMLKANMISKIKNLVPKATYDYLLTKNGQEVIKQIQTKKLGRH